MWALVALAFSTKQSAAHEKWLWPNRFIFEKPPAIVSFDVTWSDTPFAAEDAVGDKPITVVDPEGRRSSPDRAFIGKTKTTAEAELLQEGTYRLESVDPLAYWSQIEKDGKSQWLKLSKGEVAADQKVTRSDLYWSKAMAYVTVGKGVAMPPQLEADPLNIVPETRPNEIVAGSTLKLKVLSYGKPVAKANVKVFDTTASGHTPISTIKCDDEGAGEIELKSAGLYLFSCQLEKEVKDDPKADIHSFNVYLTLCVQPKK
jgi:uncharacterized GH25 family protein